MKNVTFVQLEPLCDNDIFDNDFDFHLDNG